MKSFCNRLALITSSLLIVVGSARAGGVYVQTNLVSDIPGMAEVTDPNLMDPWGIALSAKSPFWISDQATGMATLYSVNSTTGFLPLCRWSWRSPIRAVHRHPRLPRRSMARRAK